MPRYMIQSTTTGETYVSDGRNACGPLRHTEEAAPLGDYNLDDEATDWVAARDGRILREDS